LQTSTRGLASSILAWFCQDELSELVDASLIGERVLAKTSKAIMLEIKLLGERFELHESGLVRCKLSQYADDYSLSSLPTVVSILLICVTVFRW
jgi:hypothetical protein